MVSLIGLHPAQALPLQGSESVQISTPNLNSFIMEAEPLQVKARLPEV